MPLFAIHALDKPGLGHVRAENRPAHVAHLDSVSEHVLVAGPLLASDGVSMIGSLLIIDFPDEAAARAWASADPYAQAGLFETAIVRQYRKVRPL